MQVKTKLIMTLLVFIISSVLMFGVVKVGDYYISKAKKMQSEAVKVKLNLLQARRAEKNFFLRQEWKYVNKFENMTEKMKKNFQKIKKQDGGEKIKTMQELALQYKNKFMDVANLEKRIGLTEEKGLRRSFIMAGRDMESIFKNVNDKSIQIALLQCRRQEKNFIIRKTEKYLNRYKQEINRLGYLMSSNMPISVQSRAREKMEAYQKAFLKYVRAVQKEKELKGIFIRAARNLEDRLEEWHAFFENKQTEAGKVVDVSILGVCVAICLFASILVIWIIVSILRPLNSLQGYAKMVADGELEADSQFKYTGEFKWLYEAMKAMVVSLGHYIRQAREKEHAAREQEEKAKKAMRDAQEKKEKIASLFDNLKRAANESEEIAGNVAVASEQILAMFSQIQEGAKTQRDRTTETSTAMEEMNSTVTEISRNASNASEDANTSRQKAEEGAELVRQAVDSIQDVNSKTDNLRGGMEKLGTEVRSVTEIINVISDIADQTNLLALNAAIEAARAGESGRGFAVVADEVRKLAEKTMAATGDVERNIKNIQEATEKNMENVEDTVRIVSESTELANRSGRTQDEIVELVKNSAAQIMDIATASEQQATASEEVNKAILDITNIAQETEEGINNTYDSVENLNKLSERLKMLIENMSNDA